MLYMYICDKIQDKEMHELNCENMIKECCIYKMNAVKTLLRA